MCLNDKADSSMIPLLFLRNKEFGAGLTTGTVIFFCTVIFSTDTVLKRVTVNSTGLLVEKKQYQYHGTSLK